MVIDVIDVDVYYKSVAGKGIQQLADHLLRLSQQAERQAAHDAAFSLADAATQLLDVGREVGGKRMT
ncbi:MAG: hypothetical protein ACRDZ4_07370 [Egibacteraceae bacterium]